MNINSILTEQFINHLIALGYSIINNDGYLIAKMHIDNNYYLQIIVEEYDPEDERLLSVDIYKTSYSESINLFHMVSDEDDQEDEGDVDYEDIYQNRTPDDVIEILSMADVVIGSPLMYHAMKICILMIAERLKRDIQSGLGIESIEEIERLKAFQI